MARTRNIVSGKDLADLKNCIIKTYGKDVKFPVDCEKLADDIILTTKLYLSPVTLKRFMGFFKSGHCVSYQTLDILSLYCGFDCWNGFIKNKDGKPVIGPGEIKFYKDIFNLEFRKNIEEHDEVMQTLVRHIAEQLRKNPRTFEKIVPELAKNKLAQTFYFEHFPDYDNLVKFQYKGYEHYLRNKITDEAQVFGNALLFFRQYLLLSKEGMSYYHKTLESIKVNTNMHPMPVGRYFQCLILFKHFCLNEDITQIIKRVNSLEKRMPRYGLHFKNFPGFHYFVADALVQCGYYKEAQKIIDIAFRKYKIYKEFVWKGYYRQLQLLYAICMFHIDEPGIAAEMLKKIKPETFYFISRNYFTVQYNLLLMKLQKANGKISPDLEKQTLQYINNCGFENFRNEFMAITE